MDIINKFKRNLTWKKLAVIIASVMLIFIVYMAFAFNGVKRVSDILTNKNALEHTYYLIQIIGGYALIIGAIIGIWQYVLTARSERAKLSMEQVEKAIDLANYYKNEILPKSEALIYVFRSGGIKDELDKIKVCDMKEFTQEELIDNLGVAGKKNLEKIMEGEDVLTAIIAAEVILGLNLNIERFMSIEEENGKKSVSIKRDMVIRLFMGNIVSELLNSMEYFAMNFIHGIADETVVYQSLSRTYIEIVQLLYYNIANNNVIGKQLLFTNVTELYRKWYDRYSEEKSGSKNGINKGTVVNTEIG